MILAIYTTRTAHSPLYSRTIAFRLELGALFTGRCCTTHRSLGGCVMQYGAVVGVRRFDLEDTVVRMKGVRGWLCVYLLTGIAAVLCIRYLTKILTLRQSHATNHCVNDVFCCVYCAQVHSNVLYPNTFINRWCFFVVAKTNFVWVLLFCFSCFSDWTLVSRNPLLKITRAGYRHNVEYSGAQL